VHLILALLQDMAREIPALLTHPWRKRGVAFQCQLLENGFSIRRSHGEAGMAVQTKKPFLTELGRDIAKTTPATNTIRHSDVRGTCKWR